MESLATSYLFKAIDDILDSELKLLLKDISNYSAIKITEKNLEMELFILCNYLSGKGLSTIKGFNLNQGIKLVTLIDNEMKKRFQGNILNGKWLDTNRGGALSDYTNYYKNKVTEYQKIEMLYHTGEIDITDFGRRICSVLLTTEANLLDQKLIDIVVDIYKGAFLVLYNRFKEISKKFSLQD